jgi:nucleotide-binding universal stress UspA family protein
MAQSVNEISKDMEGCVMLALSTFRRSEQAIDVALSRSREGKKLMVVYVVDINTARYLVGIEEEFFVGLKDTCEEEILEKAEKEAKEHVAVIAGSAEKIGIQAKALIQRGRFALICLEVVRQVKPSLIVTTRSKRPEWVKRFFGAPVDELINKAGCPVVAV